MVSSKQSDTDFNGKTKRTWRPEMKRLNKPFFIISFVFRTAVYYFSCPLSFWCWVGGTGLYIEQGNNKKRTSTYIRNRKMVSSKQSDTDFNGKTKRTLLRWYHLAISYIRACPFFIISFVFRTAVYYFSCPEAEWHGLQRQDKTDLTARNEKIKQGRQKWNRIDPVKSVLSCRWSPCHSASMIPSCDFLYTCLSFFYYHGSMYNPVPPTQHQKLKGQEK
jgi:hypothetical protein